jgi:hypothetical protein
MGSLEWKKRAFSGLNVLVYRCFGWDGAGSMHQSERAA